MLYINNILLFRAYVVKYTFYFGKIWKKKVYLQWEICMGQSWINAK